MSKTTRTTLIAAGIFIGLLGIFAWQWYHQDVQTKSTKTQQDFLSFDVATITDVTLTRADQTVTLQKQNEQWVITSQNNITADATLVQSMLNTLNNALVQATIATGADTVTDYGLADTTVTQITLQAVGTNVATIDVGKIGAVPGTWYGRKTGESTIYLLSGTQQTLMTLDFAQTVAPATDSTTSTTLPEE